MLYWIGSALYGPRYYYEGLYSLTIVSAAGICWLASWPLTANDPFPNYRGWRRVRALGVTAILTLLISVNLIFYTPIRLGTMHALYGVSREYHQPFLTPSAQDLTPALIIVHTSGNWIEYGRLLDLQNPFLDTPFIFVIARSESANQAVAKAFPDRNVFHYYPDEPYTFYQAPRNP
jgi:hypothetical protein